MREKKIIGFIVLHYKTKNDTIRCIESLVNLNDSNESIILIVDNASNDNSLQELKERFSSFKNIVYMENKTNEGYSIANNKAYIYLKELYELTYVVILNNDTEIRQQDFIRVLMSMKLENEYDFVGPDIYSPTMKCHQNPLYKTIPSIDEQEKLISELKNRLNQLDVAIETRKRNLKKIKVKGYIPQSLISLYKLIKEGKESDYFNYQYEINDPVLVGACIIITKKYIDNFDVVFEPITYFYYEEIILAERCKRNGLKTLYTPKLEILHYHGSSTHFTYDDAKRYLLFTGGNTIKSFEIYKKYFY